MKHSIKNRPNRTVEYGAGWHIEYSPADNEYIAVMHIDGTNDPIGFASSKDDAHDLIHDWMFAQARDLAAGLVGQAGVMV